MEMKVEVEVGREIYLLVSTTMGPTSGGRASDGSRVLKRSLICRLGDSSAAAAAAEVVVVVAILYRLPLFFGYEFNIIFVGLRLVR